MKILTRFRSKFTKALGSELLAPQEDKEKDVQTTVKVKTEVIDITPELAAEWLARNAHNRNLVPRRVQHYSEAILRREWILNGESIKFDENDDMYDGQHRLAAIVKAGISIPSVVVWGLPPKAQETVDLGRSRTLSDVLRIRGETNASTLASSIVQLWRYRLHVAGQKMIILGGGVKYPTVQQSLQVLEENPGLRNTLSLGQKLKDVFRVPPSIVACCGYIFDEIDSEDGEFFWERVASGSHLSDGSPILALRKTYHNFLLAKSSPTGRKPRIEEYMALTIKAWNIYRDGRQINILSWRRGGKRPEPFPIAY